MSILVIVESPTKARTISKYLSQGYLVQASMGHVRDLPSSADEIPSEFKGQDWARIGVDIENNFQPLYVIPKSKKKVVNELKQAVKQADRVILATDEDREGESISWHLLQLLNPQVPIARMVFHEITREAINTALNNCREIDYNLVRAQETRRILDRLVGYTVSPLLWKKIASGLSAGRVQSVAVRVLVIRERARRAFQVGSYWDLKAILQPAASVGNKKNNQNTFEAKLIALNGKKVATGSDFDANTGKIAANKDVVLLKFVEAKALKERIEDKVWTVRDVEERPTSRKPAPPFTTSTLQQEANRKLGLGARDTMKTAQSLYEQGYITYMRTDSVHLSRQAIAAARSCVKQMYGAEYLSPKPRQYTTKSKGAQEAHEAIRPAGSSFRLPQHTPLSGRERSLYDLIWKRTVAGQMAEARLTQITVKIEVEEALFRSSGKRIDFPGFFRAYVEGSDDPEVALENQEIILPPLKVGDNPNCLQLDALSHETQPPARYTEASLVKTLEKEGIGRPSTYATIMGTIVDRGYVQLRSKALIPTFTAFAVTHLLEEHFAELVDPRFTSKMERTLDEISTGEAQWLPYLQRFYLGEKGLQNQVKVGEELIEPNVARAVKLENLQEEVQIKIGRFGAYIEADHEGEMVKASIPTDLTPADLHPEQIEEILRQKAKGPEELGVHPETGQTIYIKIGTYGPYLQLGEESEEDKENKKDKKDKKKKPKRASLPKQLKLEDLTLEQAVSLLSLPRLLGSHPATEAPVKAALGPYGPYVVHDQGKEGKDYRSLKAEDDVLTISLERALELLAAPKRGVVRELGRHPEDKKPVSINKNRFGLYLKHGRLSAPFPKEETEESMTLELAVSLLAQKAAKAGSKATKKKTASKSSKSSSSKKKTSSRSSSSTKKTAGTKAKRSSPSSNAS